MKQPRSNQGGRRCTMHDMMHEVMKECGGEDPTTDRGPHPVAMSCQLCFTMMPGWTGSGSAAALKHCGV